MLTFDGRCKTFDAAADGYVRAEDCVVFILEAIMGGLSDSFTAIVQGSAVNQDGRSSSLTAPNGPSQQQAGCSCS
jgi:acyl transferase domain-containing protein